MSIDPNFADKQAITEVAIAYTWALDMRNFDELDNVFTLDANGMLHGVECTGRDAIKARISKAVSWFDHTQHLVGNHQIVVTGDTATHRCQLQGMHVKSGTEGGDNYWIAGYYDDKLVRTPGGWRITFRLMQGTWRHGNPGVLPK